MKMWHDKWSTKNRQLVMDMQINRRQPHRQLSSHKNATVLKPMLQIKIYDYLAQ